MECYITFEGDIVEKLPSVNRTEKGKSIIAFPKDYTIIDIETTGLDPRYYEIIEIGAIKYRSNEIVDKFSSLIYVDEIDDFITSLTGITFKMLEKSPKIDKVIKDFYDFIGEDILVGYNVNFDINFLYDNLLETNNIALKNSFVDVMRIAKKLLPNLEKHSQQYVCEYYNMNVSQSHRAIADCELCASLFNNLKNDILKEYQSIDDFIKLFTKSNLKLSDIKATNTDYDKDHPLYNKQCVFTGTLDKMVRKEAVQLVVNLGGICSNNISKNTDYLILGNNDYCSTIKDGKSSKHKKAEKMILEGSDIKIIPEDIFYDMVLNK